MRRLVQTLGDPNFRRYAGAQVLHGTGMWVHRIAELWVVYEITGSALAVGIATSARAGSSVFLAPLAGMLADRLDRRRLLATTQFSKAAVAGLLGVVAAQSRGGVALWFLLSTIAVLGVIGAIDTPLRRAFVRDVVTVDGLERAARLHTSVMSVGRLVGGSLAAALLAVSASWLCFCINSVASVAAAILVLRVVPTTSAVTAAARAAGGSLLAYLRRAPEVTMPLALLGCFTLFGWNLEVLIPVLIDEQLSSGPAMFGLLVLVLSLGSLAGSVLMASSARSGLGSLAGLLAVFGVVLLPVAAVSSVVLALLAFAFAGAIGGGFLSLANASVQTAADPRLQGRVAATYGVVFVGARAVGGPILGWLADSFGSRNALVIVGLGTAACALVVLLAVRPK